MAHGQEIDGGERENDGGRLPLAKEGRCAPMARRAAHRFYVGSGAGQDRRGARPAPREETLDWRAVSPAGQEGGEEEALNSQTMTHLVLVFQMCRFAKSIR